jgi:excisionase family DNA binding protein
LAIAERVLTVDQLLTIGEVAQLLRINPATVYRLAKDGKIPAFKVGKEWRFTIEAVEKFMEELDTRA